MSKVSRIAVIPGDGIGKEVMPEALKVLGAAGKRFGRAGPRPIDWASATTPGHRPDDAGRLERPSWKAATAILFGAVGWPAMVPDHVSSGDRCSSSGASSTSTSTCGRCGCSTASLSAAGRKAGDIDYIVVRENTEGEYTNLGGVMYAGCARSSSRRWRCSTARP